MLDLLHAAEKELPRLIASPEGWRSFKLERHPPLVERMLRRHGDGKLLLHRIHPADAATLHRHPWPSAMRLLEGTYELTLGHGAAKPAITARPIARAPFEYEMTDADAWHSVRALGAPTLSVMVSGARWDRPLDESDDDEPPPLSDAEVAAMLERFRRHYR